MSHHFLPASTTEPLVSSIGITSATHPLPRSSIRTPVVLHTRVVRGPGGGPDKTILNSPRFLTPFGYKAICAYLHPPRDPGFDELRAKAQAWSAPLVSIHDRGPWDVQVVGRLLQLCRRERVAIWHGHDYKSNALGLVVKRFWPMRLVTTVHGWVHYTARTPLYYAVDRLCLPYYERVICVSEDLLERCLAAGASAQQCLLVENAIDTAEYARKLSVPEAKRRLGLRPERLTIGAVGRLSAEKGFDLLIRAADRLLRAGHDIEVLIVGDGDQKESLHALVSELGRQDRVHLLGYRADTIELYQAMDIFTLSSLREGLPNVLLEAMALEVSVVATRVAGVPRLIHSGQNGMLVDSGNLDALTDTLAHLLKDAGLRMTLGHAGRRTIETCYSFDARMQKIRAVYDDLLGRH